MLSTLLLFFGYVFHALQHNLESRSTRLIASSWPLIRHEIRMERALWKIDSYFGVLMCDIPPKIYLQYFVLGGTLVGMFQANSMHLPSSWESDTNGMPIWSASSLSWLALQLMRFSLLIYRPFIPSASRPAISPSNRMRRCDKEKERYEAIMCALTYWWQESQSEVYRALQM